MEKKEQGQEELLMDFSTMFKGKKGGKKPILKSKQNEPAKTPNWLLEIPAKLDITTQEIKARRFMDESRWMSMAKALEPNHKYLAAVVSSWNYFYSQKGYGEDKFLSCKNALMMIKQEDEGLLCKKVQEFERVEMIQRIVQILNKKTGRQMKSETCVKLSPPNQIERTNDEQRQDLLKKLDDKKEWLIYLAYEDVFCPIGFEYTPLNQLDAFMQLQKIKNNHELWIISSCVGRGEPSFSIKRWEHIEQDLRTQWPQFLDIKHPKQGIQKREDCEGSEQKRGNYNCILRVWTE